MTEIELKAVDCIEGMRAMAAESVDVVVTSPPYNLGIKYKKYNDRQKLDIYLRWTRDWLREVRRVMKPEASLFLNLGGSPKSPMLPYQVIPVALDIFKLQNTFHWIKSISVDIKGGETLSVGHFKPINSGRFVNDCHEFVFHLTKTGKVPINRLALGVPYADKSNVKRWSHTDGRDNRCRGNLWYIPYKTIQSRNKQRPHPATFPPRLAEYAIRIHGATPQCPDYIVLDPFVGIGNSALGARAVGVNKFVGFDLDDYYIGVAQSRMT